MKIGITGSIGTGKSTVTNMLVKKGYKVLDADQIAHDALKKGTVTYDQIVSKWDVLDDNNEISRVKLGNIVFNDQDAKSMLEAIIHPYVIDTMIKNSENEPLIFLDIPLLYENNLQYLCDKITVVYCNEALQLQRVIDRNHYSVDEAKLRINSQISVEKKKELADYIIDNSGDLKHLEEEVERFLKDEVIY